MSGEQKMIAIVLAALFFAMAVDSIFSDGDVASHQRRMYEAYVEACVEQGVTPEPPHEWSVDE